MRSTVNVHLVVLLALVVRAFSLVTAERQGSQEQSLERNRRANELLDRIVQRYEHQELVKTSSKKYSTGSTAKSEYAKLWAVTWREYAKELVDKKHHRRKTGQPLLPAILLKKPERSAKVQVKPEESQHASQVQPLAAVSVKTIQTAGAAEVSSRERIDRRVIRRFEAWKAEYLPISRRQSIWKYGSRIFFSVLLWAALTLLLGLYYHQEKLHPPKLDPEGVNVSLHDRERLDRQRWRFGLHECADVPSLCVFSFLCAPVRWADTMRMAGFMDFFPALALVVGMTVFGYFTLGLGFIALGAVCVHFRQRMREKFDVRSHSLSTTYKSDVLAFLFCPWCSIVQEARQIEEAYLSRHASVRHEYTARPTIPLRLAAAKV